MAWHEIIIIVVLNYFCKILCQLFIWYTYILYHLISYRRGGIEVDRLTCVQEIKARSPVGTDLSRFNSTGSDSSTADHHKGLAYVTVGVAHENFVTSK